MTDGRKPGHHVDGRPRRVRRGCEVYLELKGDPTRSRRSAPAPAPAPTARPITGLMTDGGTTFATWSDRELWHPRFVLLVEQLQQLQRDVADGVLDPDDVPNMLLPLPTLPDAPTQRGLAGVLAADGTKRLDYRNYGFGGVHGWPLAMVGLKGRSIVLHFRDRAFVQLQQRVDGNTGQAGWYVSIQAKHKELYDRGIDEWLRTWLGYFSWLLFDTWAVPSDLRRLGWTTTQWHVNADFIGLTFVSEDVVDVTGVRKRSIYGRHDDYADEVSDDPDDDDDEPPPWMQTWQLGRRTSDIAIVGYKKGDQLREAKGLEPAASAYARHWRAHGWTPAEGDPFRVEVRARKKGLVYRRVDSDEIIYDFRDPALLCDDVARRTFWAKVTGRRRMVTRTGARVRRCETDPRWAIVQSVAQLEDPEGIRQMPHDVAALTREERMAKSGRKLFDALQDLALDRGVGLETASDFAAALRELADRVDRGEQRVDRLGAGTLPNPWRPAQALRRKPARVQFYLEQLIEEIEPLQEALRRYGGDGGCTVFELMDLPDPRARGPNGKTSTEPST